MSDKKPDAKVKKEISFLKEIELNMEAAIEIVEHQFGSIDNLIQEINNKKPLEQQLELTDRQVCLQETLKALNASTVAKYLKV